MTERHMVHHNAAGGHSAAGWRLPPAAAAAATHAVATVQGVMRRFKGSQDSRSPTHAPSGAPGPWNCAGAGVGP